MAGHTWQRLLPLFHMVALVKPSEPGQLLDLSKFKLQLPVGNGKGGVVEILPEELKTYSSPFFFVDDGSKAATFWCPVNGNHTTHSKYPRTELRELIEWSASNSGAHTLNATAAVSKAPPSGNVVVGQVHGTRSDHCGVVLELEWESSSGSLEARLRDANCNTVSKNVGYDIHIGTPFSYSVIVEGSTLTVSTEWQYSGSTRRKTTGPYSLTQPLNQSLYFKVGDYVQDTGSSSTVGGEVQVLKLHTDHPPASVYMI